MGINSIQYDTEKYAGIKVKFRRPLHNIRTFKDELKDITIKIYSSGKINIDGGKEIYEIEELYLWLNHILTKNQDLLIIDIVKSMKKVLKTDDDLTQDDLTQEQLVTLDDILVNENEPPVNIRSYNLTRSTGGDCNALEQEYNEEEESEDETF